MTDRDFLMWLHERLEHVHHEDQCLDYMYKLRSIIRATPKERYTQNCCSYTSLGQLKQVLKDGHK